MPAAEILAASEAIDEGKMIAKTVSQLLGIPIPLTILVDSKDLFTSMSTQRNSIDRSIRGDVGCIRFEFQTGNIQNITWIPGKTNIADVLNNTDSFLTEALNLTIGTGKLSIDYTTNSETKCSERNLG